MTGLGREKTEEAKRDGQWDARTPWRFRRSQPALISALPEGREPARTHFWPCPCPCKRPAHRPASTPKQSLDGSGGPLGWRIGSAKI